MPHVSKHSSHVAKEIPLPSSSSKPIHIVRSSKHKVVLVLPAQVQPPVVSSYPSHRTAPTPHPVLISRNNHSHGSAPSSSPLHKYMANRHRTHSNVPASGPSRSPPAASSSSNKYHSSTAMARSSSHDSFYNNRSTITPKRMPESTLSTLEDEYYSHPAVREYEMQKAAEQARWTRNRMMQRAEQQQRGRDPHPRTVYYDDLSRATITSSQQRY